MLVSYHAVRRTSFIRLQLNAERLDRFVVLDRLHAELHDDSNEVLNSLA